MVSRVLPYLSAAVLLVSGGASARAADLGGNCCADLEERIAELEATSVRKGNRKVSLAVSGYVSHHLMYWDDGHQSDVYIGDGGNYGSRFRFVGKATITRGITAGFLYEFGVSQNSIDSMNQLNGSGAVSNSGLNGDDAGASTNPLLRDSTVWLRHNQLGMLKIGHGSTATDNLVSDLLITPATPDIALFMGGFILRGKDGTLGSGTNLNWKSAIRGHESWDTTRRNHVLYETPTLYGVTMQAAVAEDNFWDIALRYSGEVHNTRIFVGVGYQEDAEFNRPQGTQTVSPLGALCNNACDVKTSEIKASGLLHHLPSGMFVTGAAGNRELSGSVDGTAATRYSGPDLRFWWLAGGVAKDWFGIGRTALYGEYGEHKGGLEQQVFLKTDAALGNVDLPLPDSNVTNTRVTTWGAGVVQNIDAAAMEVFVAYKKFSFDGSGFGVQSGLNSGVSDIQSVILGTRVQF